MNFSFRFKLMSAAMAFVLIFSMAAPITVFANDATPEEPTPGESTPPADEPVAEETPAAEEAIETSEAVETGEVPAETLAPAADGAAETPEAAETEESPTETLADVVQALSESEAVLVDSEGEPLALASNEAAELLTNPDPYVDRAGVRHRFLADCTGQPIDANNTCTVSATPIQAAINFALAGETVVVLDGTFVENVNINKTLTLSGNNAGIDPNTGTRVAESIIQGLVSILADGVKIDGFTIKNPDGTFGIQMVGSYDNIVITNNIVTDVGTNVVTASANTYGILVQPGSTADNIEISNNLVDNVEAPRTAGGIGIIGSGGTGNVTNAVIEGNVVQNITAFKGGVSGGAYGILINHGASSTGMTVAPVIVNNTVSTIDGKWAHGIGLEGDTPGALVEGNVVDNVIGTFNGTITDSAALTLQQNDGADSVTITGNSFTNAEYGIINMTALAVDASGNWWGTTDSAAVSALMLSLGNNIDYSPYLASGADQSGAVGFQGDFSVLIVDPASPQTEAHLKNAIDLLEPGGTLLILPGTFYENVQVTKSATLQGSGQGSTIIMPANNNANTCAGSCPSTTNTLVWVLADGVSIFDLTLDGDSDLLSGGQSVGGADVNAHNGIVTNSNTDLTVQDVTVQNVYARGIQMGTSGGTFNFSNNTITNVQGDYFSMGIFNTTSGGVIDGNTISDVGDGIAMNWSNGTQVTNNTVTNAGSGIHTDNSQGPDVISNNTVTNGKTNSYGIFVFAPYGQVTVSDNDVNDVDYGLTLSGNGFGSSLDAVTFDGNTVDANVAGAYVTGDVWGYFKSNAYGVFSNNTIAGAQYGFYLESQANGDYVPGYYGASDCGGGDCTVQVTLICNDITGQIFQATGSIFWDGNLTPNYNGIYIVDDSGNVCTVTPPSTTTPTDGGDAGGAGVLPPATGGGLFIPVTGGQTLSLNLDAPSTFSLLNVLAAPSFPLAAEGGLYSFSCLLESVTTLTPDQYIVQDGKTITSVGQCSYLVNGVKRTMTIALTYLGEGGSFNPGDVLLVNLAEGDFAAFAGSGNPFDAGNFMLATSLDLLGVTATVDLTTDELLAALEGVAEPEFPLAEENGAYELACVLESVTVLDEGVELEDGQVATAIGVCSYLKDGGKHSVIVALSYEGGTDSYAPGEVLSLSLSGDAAVSFAGSGNPDDLGLAQPDNVDVTGDVN